MLGKMRHRIRIEKRTRTGDGYGGAGSTWELVSNGWAYIRPKSATETFSRDRIEEQQTYLITMRYRSTFNASYRIVHDSNAYNIVSVTNLEERDEMIEIEATRGSVA